MYFYTNILIIFVKKHFKANFYVRKCFIIKAFC